MRKNINSLFIEIIIVLFNFEIIEFGFVFRIRFLLILLNVFITFEKITIIIL